MTDLLAFVLANPTAVVTFTHEQRLGAEPVVMVYIERDGTGWRMPATEANAAALSERFSRGKDITAEMDSLVSAGRNYAPAAPCPGCEARAVQTH